MRIDFNGVQECEGVSYTQLKQDRPDTKRAQTLLFHIYYAQKQNNPW